MGCCSSSSGNAHHPLQATHTVNKDHQGVQELKSNYRISETSKVLGSGSYGEVFLSENIADPTFKVAIKVLNKDKLKENLDNIKEEVRILTRLDHPNIVKYYETYDDPRYIYLVMEYCNGGELFEKIANQQNQMFNESEAAQIMIRLVRAVNHCHASGVVHRDIKPENIMYGRDGEVKLIDFGLSKRIQDVYSNLTEAAGTPSYMAPEVFRGDYNNMCDIWSLGVLMYVLVSGYLPFQGEDRQSVQKKVMAANYHFNHKEFEMVSEEGKDLIMQMLVVEPTRRPPADKILKHRWFEKFQNIQKGSAEDILDPRILSRLREYKSVSALKRAAMNILVKMADDKEIEQLRVMFTEIDKDTTGFITTQELKDALTIAKIKIEDDEFENIIKELDQGGDKKINYSEFLAATLSVKKVLTDEKLSAIFKQFDTDSSGRITAQNISEAMQKLGRRITNKEIREIMEKHDITRDGSISFEEFKTVFQNIS